MIRIATIRCSYLLISILSWARDVKLGEVLSPFTWREDSHYLVPSVDLAVVEALSGHGGHYGNVPGISQRHHRTHAGFNTYVLSWRCIPNRLCWTFCI